MRRSTRDPLTNELRSLGFADSVASRLARAGTPIDLAEGTALTVKGERGEEAFLLVKGEAVVDLGPEQVRIGPGAVVGELAALDPLVRRNATVRTTTPALVVVYDVQTFRSLASGDLHEVLGPERTAPPVAA